VHGSLDAAGFIPGFGEIADGLNGLIYLGEGRYIEASISAAAMIPIIGDLGKAGKWTVKVGKELVEVAAEVAAKQALKTTAKKAAQQAVENIVKESAEVTIDKATKKVLKKAAQESAENALERSSKQVARVALATAREAGQEMSEQVVKDLVHKSTKNYLTSIVAIQVARDAAERGAKVALDYPKGLVKYQEFVSTMTQISQRAKAAIPGGKPGQILGDLDQLYREAAQATSELHEFIERLAKQTNGTPQFRSKLKDVERVLEKMDLYYAGDASRVTDITAGRIVYDKLEDLYRALDEIHTDPQFTFFKDRFLEPQKSGYRDILMNVELSNGHIGELRLEVGPMNRAAEIEHQLYEMRRPIEDLNCPLTPEERLILKELKEQSNLVLEEAWKEVIAKFAAK
jgi:hypothetical protein